MKTDFALNDAQKSLLCVLLDRLENSSGTRMISIRVEPNRFPDYFDDTHPSKVRSSADSIEQLAALGWVRLDHGKSSESHRISRIQLNTEYAGEIGRALGRIELGEWRAQSLALVQALLARSKEPLAWVEFLKNEEARIMNSSPSSQTRQELLEELSILYPALEKLISRVGITNPCTWRQFSVKYFANSKKLDSLKSKISKILASHLGLANEMEESVILSYFGIQAKEEVFLIQGPVNLHTKQGNGGTLRGVGWAPFFAIPATMADPEKSDWDFSSVEAVITIENEESFHSWCARSPKPTWLTIYLGGFPSREKTRFLAKVAQEVETFHHWGDLDCGGISIFRFLEKEIQKDIIPLGMNASLLSRHSDAAQMLSPSEKTRLNTIRSEMAASHPLTPTVEAMLALGLKLEQEAIVDPIA